jgi:hypothetical protein
VEDVGYVSVEGVDDDVGRVNFDGAEDCVGNFNVERSGTKGLTPTIVDLIKIICTILRVDMYK